MAAREGYTLAGKRVLIAGFDAMAAAALRRRLAREDCAILTLDDGARGSARRIAGWLKDEKADAAFVLAGREAATACLEGARDAEIGKLLYLAGDPSADDDACLALCRECRAAGGDFIAGAAAELYGPGDRYDPGIAGTVAEAIARIHAAASTGAASVTLTRPGEAMREFLYTEDLADGLVFMMKRYSGEARLDIGTGVEIAIGDMAAAVARAVGWAGRIAFADDDRGARRMMNVRPLAALGWSAKTRFEDGLKVAYEWFEARAGRSAARA